MPDPQTMSAQIPKRPFSALSATHPRRCHPSQSKSLPKNKRVKIEYGPDGLGQKPGTWEGRISPNLLQGESRDSSSDQSAAKWFTSRNENVLPRERRFGQETDSPFYLGCQTSGNSAGNLQSHNGESFAKQARVVTENDELRGVIDDLTVQNKKLKTVLKNRHSHGSPVNSTPDRVLEVRMHGLPPEKKRQLEEMLRKFAADLGDSPSQPIFSALMGTTEPDTGFSPESGPGAKIANVPADSAYASMSLSGLKAVSQAGSFGLTDREPVSMSKRETDIKNYLYDIPDSLLPRETISVSDEVKMRLVVQRLEHLFTGKTAAPGEHSLPLQQQQISQSAAKADRREDRRLQRTTKAEGSREAQILPPDTRVNLDAIDVGALRLGNPPALDSPTTEALATGSPERLQSEQRPTRPLDLDVQRAQVAADNVEYIRHLGLSSPQFNDAEDNSQPWLYLNLLASMAQMHTLNVTPAFIRQAVKRISRKFELSKDGHKIRWVSGGTAISGSPNSGSPHSVSLRASEDNGDERGPQSGRSTGSTSNNVSTSISDDKALQGTSSSASRLVTSATTPVCASNGQTSGVQSKSIAFDYKPVVFQGQRAFLKAKDSYLDSSTSYDDESPRSGGPIRARSRSSRKSPTDSYEGYVTFFNNPYFFTDLSGDKATTNLQLQGFENVQSALGMKREDSLTIDDPPRDAYDSVLMAPSPHEAGAWPYDYPEMEMSLAAIERAGEQETQPMEFVASGIGGVRPEDNFALDVQVSRQRQKGRGEQVTRRVGVKLPAAYSYRTEKCERISLLPSRLPSPSYVFFAASSSSDADKELTYADDESEESDADYSPAPAGFLWQWSSSSNELEADNDDGSESSSSLDEQEVSGANVLRPTTVNQMERPGSGSMAATAGASWSAASNAHETEVPRYLDQESDDDSLDSMSVEGEE